MNCDDISKLIPLYYYGELTPEEEEHVEEHTHECGGCARVMEQQRMLAAAHEDNPAVRGESVDILKNQCRSGEVRDTLLNALAQDSNPYVRLKAMEGLKSMSGDAEVRRVLGHVLLADNNPAVKMQAIDLLVAQRDDNMVGLMQALVQRENNSPVRLKMEKWLKEMNASPGTF